MLKHIFVSLLLAALFPENSWLNELTNFDALVENNTLDFAVVGADPDVVINNTNWPLTPTQRTDTALTMVLATFDTEPTHVTNVEELETNYAKAQSVFNQHINTLKQKAAKSAAYNIAPSSNTSDTPVITTTGTVNANSVYVPLSYADITEMSLKYNELNYPEDGRILLLCPQHQKDLKLENLTLFRSVLADGKIDGFKVYMTTNIPQYDSSGDKVPMGAVGLPTSIAFIKSEVCRAVGTVNCEAEKRWADYRGILIGAQMRFLAQRIKDKGVMAIYSKAITTA